MAKLLGKFIKQPNEILDYDIDFSEWFTNRTDEPASHTSFADSNDITIQSSQLSGSIVKVILSGGTDGGSYKITVRLTTTAGLVKEVDFQVRVKEV